MNCKQGQLAFIKKAIRQENIGKVITCIKHLGYYERGASIQISGELWEAFDSDDYWLTEGNLSTQFGAASQAYIADSWLIPIEPLPPEDTSTTNNLLEDDLALAE